VIQDLLETSKVRYLIAGVWNTIFGYSLGVVLFLLLTDAVHTAIISIFLIWFFVDVVGWNIWISQGLTIGITVLISYFGHKKFTFRK